jgi:S1-C subfamily serine protease
VTPTPDEILDRAVWVVENSETCVQGTAFFLNGVGLVTAAHCVEGVNEVDVFHPTKHTNTFKATIRKHDADRDLAILDHAIPTTEYFELDPISRQISTGDDTRAVGYPSWGYGDRINDRPGVVSAQPKRSAVKFIEVTQNLSDGMSGGPLLDNNGTVTGIMHKGGPKEGRNFAVHIEALMDWLAES